MVPPLGWILSADGGLDPEPDLESTPLGTSTLSFLYVPGLLGTPYPVVGYPVLVAPGYVPRGRGGGGALTHGADPGARSCVDDRGHHLSPVSCVDDDRGRCCCCWK